LFAIGCLLGEGAQKLVRHECLSESLAPARTRKGSRAGGIGKPIPEVQNGLNLLRVNPGTAVQLQGDVDCFPASCPDKAKMAVNVMAGLRGSEGGDLLVDRAEPFIRAANKRGPFRIGNG
jgi:hypothetical protein